MIKLNKKLQKIHKKVYELLKLSILAKVDYKFILEKEKDEKTNSQIYPHIEEKIQELVELIKKYFEGIENIDEDTQNNIIKNSIEFEEKLINDSVINEEWFYLSVCKDK
jgi:hypothetical protein